MKKIVFVFIGVFLFCCCKNNKLKTLEKGTYKGILKVKDNKLLPFIFKVINDSTLYIYNADERIIVNEITYKNDSIRIQTPVFEGYISGKIKSDGTIVGAFIKPSLDRIVPFYTEKTNQRFVSTSIPKHTVSGYWETIFSPNSNTERYIAKGIFKQTNHKVTGTFRTTTGDYRYLEGVVEGDSLKLSTFDGAHAFLFVAKITDSLMNGIFYSGNHWKEPFIATLNNNYELPNENELTYLKKGYENFNFSFPDVNGNIKSLSDHTFKNEVVVVQIMGTWCPNCLDESKFLTNYLKNNPTKKFKVVALAFEVAKTKDIAFKRIQRLAKKIGISYPILLADYGNIADKKMANKKLPMLSDILSYPTTIFIDKKGTVRKIHTGFNGPATGDKYEEFKKEFDAFITKLINEK